ncbi:MAG: PASTA domain-containing protein, partial [Ruminococcus sp.]|nr:PASTA domain-containing protein [Ruminococcus sp.]
GVMMYEMLTGKKPFDSDNPVSIAVMHMHDIPERLRAINPDIPDGLEEIVLKAMEKAPEDRYQTTTEMIADIEAFKNDPSMTFGYYQEEDENDGENTINFAAPVSGDVQTEDQNEVDNAYAQRTPAYANVPAGSGMGAAAPPPPMYPNQQMQQPAYPDGYYDEGEEDEEEEERSSLVVPVLTAIVVVVIVVAVVFVALLLSDLLKGSGKKSDYTMPDFYNMDYNEALSQYGNSINFEIDGQEYNVLDENRIFEQSIEPGKEFNKGDTLKVKVSKGQEIVEIPKLRNVNVELAKQQLKSRGLECEIKRKPDPDIEAGNVIDTDPAEGTEVHKGQKILVNVSMGANKGTIKVEDYKGQDISDASYKAGFAGLKVNTEGIASYEPENKVVKQSIEKGELVEEGTEITLYYSNGKDPEGEIKLTINFPPDGNGNMPEGRFVIDYIILEEENMGSVQSPVLLVPEFKSHTQTIKGSGEKVTVKASLTNLANNRSAIMATYTFNFAEKTIATQSENIAQAFSEVGGYPVIETEPETQQQWTEPETQQPWTEPPQQWTQPTQPTQPTQQQQ